MLAIDIDDTLCATTLWWIQLFQERFGNPEGLSAQAILEKYEIVQRVPYRQTPDAKNLIHQLVNDDSSWLDLPLYDKAVEAVEQLSTLTSIVYLTSRTQDHYERTQAWLEKHTFPKQEIIMRPSETDIINKAGEQFDRKAHYLLQHYPDIQRIIDNSISLASELDTLAYPGKQILFGHTTVKDVPTEYSIRTWHEVDTIVPLFT